MSCMIPANPDISGVGVRVAIYMQNFLSFIPAFWALTDGVVSQQELNTVEKQSISILITAFAILISTIVQACTYGLSDFHTSIILSLSWMNNTNTFIYFLLYISYKCHPQRKGEMVERQWKAWLIHVWDVIWRWPHTPSDSPDEENEPTAEARGLDTPKLKGAHHQGLIGWMQHTLRLFRKRIVFTLGSLHLTLMAAIGIWLWSSPHIFEERQETRTDGAAFEGSDGLPLACTYVSLVGSNIPLTSSVLRYVSLVIYSLFLIPGLNLLVPAIFFLLMFIGVGWRRSKSAQGSTHRWILPFHRQIGRDNLLDTSMNGTPQLLSGDKDKIDPADHEPNVKPIWIGLIILLVINVVFLADIEVTITRAKHDHKQQPGESEWTFGQTLALLLLVLPLRDVIDYGAIQEQIRAKRATRDMVAAVQKGNTKAVAKAAKAADNLFIHINGEFPSILLFATVMGDLELSEFALSKLDVNNTTKQELKRSIEQTSKNGMLVLGYAAREGYISLVQLLLEHGANVNQSKKNGVTPLIYAAHGGHVSIVRLFLERGVDINQSDSNGQTSLIRAAAKGHKQIVQLLLERSADINVADEDGRTALWRAADEDYKPIVQLLLEHGADVSLADKDGGTPLIRAAYRGREPIMHLLVEHGADISLADNEGKTPLIWGAHGSQVLAVQFLLERGAKINQAEKDGTTPLIYAVRECHEFIVRLLLQHGADINQAGRDGTTALLQAAYWGHLSIIQILVNSGAELERTSINGRTALHCAARGNELGAVQLLLMLGADVARVDKDGRTALDFAQEEGYENVATFLKDTMEQRKTAGKTGRSSPIARADADEENEREVSTTPRESVSTPQVSSEEAKAFRG